MTIRRIAIFSGGTTVRISPHLSLCAEAYGKVGRQFADVFHNDVEFRSRQIHLDLINTKMADQRSSIATNDDLSVRLDDVLNDPSVVSIIMAAAICDFKPNGMIADGKYSKDFGLDCPRLHGVDELDLHLSQADKIINKIKSKRPDIFLVTFKTTSNESNDTLVRRSKKNLAKSNSNIVFGNDIQRKVNIVVTEKENIICSDRTEAVKCVAQEVIEHLKVNE